MKKYAGPFVIGKYYHVYNRACGFEKLFIEEKNYRYFLDLFTSRLGNYLDLYCYSLLPNHFHFLVRIKENELTGNVNFNISKLLSNFFCSYAMSFNKYHHRKGNLFSQNYRRIPIEDFTYLRTVVVYIHRNPIKHGLVIDLNDWDHSSYNTCLEENSRSNPFSEVIEWFGNKEIFKFCHLIDPDSDIELK